MTSIGLTPPVLRLWTELGSGLARRAVSLREGWRRARELRETRRYIMEMDQHMLADLGVSRAQALFEIDRAARRRD